MFPKTPRPKKEPKRMKARVDRKLIEWSRKVRERDDYVCQKCGKRDEANHAHHVSPRSQRPDLKYDVDNGKTLCWEPCHSWVHAHPIEAERLGLLSTEKYEARRT
jgi:5-methylcytosine-specific restriction endonuclease McrA